MEYGDDFIAYNPRDPTGILRSGNLMGNEGSDDHGIIRSDFPGGWPSDSDKNAFTGKGLNNDERWAQQRIKALLQLRQTYPQLFQGKLKHYAPVDGVYTYFREAEKGLSAVPNQITETMLKKSW